MIFCKWYGAIHGHRWFLGFDDADYWLTTSSSRAGWLLVERLTSETIDEPAMNKLDERMERREDYLVDV